MSIWQKVSLTGIFILRFFFLKKMCLPKQKSLYPRDLFFPNEFGLLKCWFPCIFFQRCEFHNHLKGSLHFCSVLLFSHIPLPFGPGSIWVGWMRRGRVAARVARGHLNSCVNGRFWEQHADNFWTGFRISTAPQWDLSCCLLLLLCGHSGSQNSI